MRKTIFDDGFQAYLTEGATIVGAAGIPMLMDLDNVQIANIFTFTNMIKSSRGC